MGAEREEMMAVSLLSLRDALMPGVTLAFKAKDTLPDFGDDYPHLRKAVAALGLRTVGDLQSVPKSFYSDDGEPYECKLVFAGREYPQGWGRGPGGAAAEPPPEPDGKVDTYQWEDNANMRALRAEIVSFEQSLVGA